MRVRRDLEIAGAVLATPFDQNLEEMTMTSEYFEEVIYNLRKSEQYHESMGNALIEVAFQEHYENTDAMYELMVERGIDPEADNEDVWFFEPEEWQKRNLAMKELGIKSEEELDRLCFALDNCR